MRKNRTAAQFAALIIRRARQITIPLNTLISYQGIAPAEAALRDMYYAGSLERNMDSIWS